MRINGAWLPIVLSVGIVWCPCAMRPQDAPVSANAPWHPREESPYRNQAKQISSAALNPPANAAYTLAELIDFAEMHNPDTRRAWESARARVDALGVARSELYPHLVALAFSQTGRQQVYLADRFYRQTIQSFDLALDLNYTIFDFGGRRGRIGRAKEQLLAADFAFNDAHRRLIYDVESAYYKVLNAMGQEEAARADVANADAVSQAAEASLKNGLATLPDVLEARSAAARAQYDLQAAIGTEELARGRLAVALGASPTQPIPVQPLDQIANPDQGEVSVDEAIDRAVGQRPDMLMQVAEIRSANARVKEAKAEYFPSLRAHVYPDPQTLYGMQQQFPWGHTAGLDGQLTLSLSWTVFDGGARKNALSEAKHNAHAAEAQASATRDAVENEVWTAYSNVKTAFRQREAAAALLQAASQSYDAALQSYHYGVRNLLDVTEAQRNLAHARSADVLARTQVLSSIAELAFQTADSVEPGNAGKRP